MVGVAGLARYAIYAGRMSGQNSSLKRSIVCLKAWQSLKQC